MMRGFTAVDVIVPKAADETLVLFKTSAARYPDLEAFLVRSHPYEVPEIIALPLSAGSAAYLRWAIDNSTP